MAQAPQFEFPAQMRELAEKNVAQARAACGQFMDAARKVQDVIGTMLPENSMTVGMKQVHEQAMGFTRQNLDASFFVGERTSQRKGFAGDVGNPKSSCATADGGLFHAGSGAWPTDGRRSSKRSHQVTGVQSPVRHVRSRLPQPQWS
jgi:hypothetical protein